MLKAIVFSMPFSILFSIPVIAALSFSSIPVAHAAIAPGPFGAKSQLLASPAVRPEAAPTAIATTPQKPTLDLGCADLRRNALRMFVHVSNLMNRNTTRTPQGGAYKRLEVVCKAAGGAFCNVESVADTKLQYSPGHPDADTNGYVAMPAINPGSESAGLNLAAGEMKVLAMKGICGAKGIQDGAMTIVKYDSDFDVMMDTMTFTADGRMTRWSRTTRDGHTQNLSFKDDGTPVGL
jgi:flagellar basal-body rod protein FlgC